MKFDLSRVAAAWRPPLAMPSSCLVCQSWQADTVCTSCRRLFAPLVERCKRCGLSLGEGESITGVCSACVDYPPELDQCIVATDFGLPWSDLISRLKFQATPAMARTLSKLMATAVKEAQGDSPDLIVPIPLSRQRWRERGYNQSWLLAQGVARSMTWSNRLCSQTLARVKHTERLMGMQADERRQHIRGAFQVDQAFSHKVAGQHVVIVDDVMTTGATINEAARVMWAAGAASVTGWFLARTPAPSSSRGQPTNLSTVK